MYSYLLGKIISAHQKTIVVESCGVGYLIYVSRPEQFEVGKGIKLYMYKHMTLSTKNTVVEEMYGFKNWQEKEFFMACLRISGIGPKTTMTFLKNDINVLKQLIANKDTEALEQLPGISKRYACMLIDYLSDMYVKNKTENFDNIADVINVLKTLGYSQEDINFAINKLCDTNAIENTMETSDIVSMAIKVISIKNETAIAKA